MKLPLLTIALFSLSMAQAQPEHASPPESPHGIGEPEGMKGSNRLGFGLGHTHISEGKVDGKTQWLATASWSLNFDHWISDKWAIGVQSDMILENFKIEGQDKQEIERSYPLSLVPVAIFKPGEHWSFVGGAGIEFSSGHNIGLTRLGMEYGRELPKGWELGAALVWDDKWNYYNSWGLAIVISRVWKKTKAE